MSKSTVNWETRRIEEKAGYLPNLCDSNLFESRVYNSAKKQFFDALLKGRDCVKHKQPVPAEERAKILEPLVLAGKQVKDKDLEEWLRLRVKHLFTWRDYSQAWYRQKAVLNENSGNADLIWSASVNVCFAYYYFNNLYKEEDFASFMKHVPFDYTRPHGWYNHPDYISMGEALTAMINFTERKGVVADAEKTLKLFAEQYPGCINEKPTKFSDLLLPYQLYSKCFDEAHSVEKIRPNSIEICIYYVQQNGLPIENIFEEKAPPNHPKKTNFYYYYGASFKFFDTFDLMRFLTVWKLFLNIFGRTVDPSEWKDEQFAQHCRNLFKFSRYSGGETLEGEIPTNKFFWWGIQRKDHHANYREILKESLSFFGDILNGIAFSLVLEAQIIRLFEPKRKTIKLDELQKVLCTQIYAKHAAIKEWLEKQYVNRKHVLVSVAKPHWKCAHEDVFHLIPALPTTTEAFESEKLYVGTQFLPKTYETFIFKPTLRTLVKNLKDADLTQIASLSLGEPSAQYSLFGMQALKSQRSYEYSLHKDVRRFRDKIRNFLGIKDKHSAGEEIEEEEEEPIIEDWEDIQKELHAEVQDDANFIDLPNQSFVDSLLYIY